MDKFYGFMDAFYSPGAITFLFFLLTLFGAVAWTASLPGGEKIFETFCTALTTFSVGHRMGQNEKSKEDSNTNSDPNKKV